MPASLEHIRRVLKYLKEMGEEETLATFNIKKETLDRYKRRLRTLRGQCNKKMPDSLNKIPKVLILDVETSLMKVFVWGCHKQRIGHKQIIETSHLISWAAKWLFDPEMYSDVLSPREAVARDDGRIIKSLWKMIDQADVIIAHNLNKFDLPVINTRMIMHGMYPPSPFMTVDTLKVLQKGFRFPSNKLDFIGRLVRNKGKKETEYELWIKCSEGNEDALAEMVEYNEEDVFLLEEVYVFFRAYIKSHPNMAMYAESTEPSCPTCGSADIKENGYYYTSVNRFLAFRCNNCGAICRSRATDISIKQKRGILAPPAR